MAGQTQSIRARNQSYIASNYPNEKDNMFTLLGNEIDTLPTNQLRDRYITKKYEQGIEQSNKKVTDNKNSLVETLGQTNADLVMGNLGDNVLNYDRNEVKDTGRTIIDNRLKNQNIFEQNNAQSGIADRLQAERTRMLKQQFNPTIKNESAINTNVQPVNIVPKTETSIAFGGTPASVSGNGIKPTTENTKWTFDHNEGTNDIYTSQYGEQKKVAVGTKPITGVVSGYDALSQKLQPTINTNFTAQQGVNPATAEKMYVFDHNEGTNDVLKDQYGNTIKKPIGTYTIQNGKIVASVKPIGSIDNIGAREK
jgi:hypothetical protein